MADEKAQGDSALSVLQEHEESEPKPEQENQQEEEQQKSPEEREPEEPEIQGDARPASREREQAEEQDEEGAETVEQSHENSDLSEGEAEPKHVVQEEAPLLKHLRSKEDSQAEAGTEFEEEEEVEEEEEDEERSRTAEERSQLIRQYLSLSGERDRLQQLTQLMQHRLCTYLKRHKSSEIWQSSKSRSLGPTTALTTGSTAEMEQHYQRCLEAVKELRAQHSQDSAQCQQQTDEMQLRCQELLDHVAADWQTYQERKKQVALTVLSRRGGKQAAVEEMEQMQAREQRKEEMVVQVRLENIKLKERVNALETQLRASEELAEGLHLIDFEQLKIENQTYNEKIEERNEELQKLRRKITGTVHILAHLKEKLQCVQAENQVKKERLAEVEATVAHRRDILTKTKQARDSLRISNVKLRQKCGLLGNEALLRDFEDKTDASEELSHRLETLKRRHAELTLNCSGIKKKIKEAKEAREAKEAKAALQQ